jgi:WD40-like Beta Propeller Repeat
VKPHHTEGRLPNRTAIASVCSVVVATLLLSLAGQAQAACPNEAIRKSQSSEALPKGSVEFPACMALELVSPSQKLLQPAFAGSFSSSGDRVLFKSLAGLADTPSLLDGIGGDHYVARRGAVGWSTSPTAPPADAEILAGSRGPYALSPQLDRWLGFGATQAQGQMATMRFYRQGLDDSFLLLSGLLVPDDDTGAIFDTVVPETRWTGTSRDLSTTLFSPKLASTTYLPGDPGEDTISVPEIPGGDRKEYVVSRNPEGNLSLELLARDKDGAVHGGFCGTHIGGGVSGGGNGRLDQGAISADGQRIYFSTRPTQPGKVEGKWVTCDTSNPLRIMVRTRTAEGPVIEELFEGGPAEGSDLYQAASADGSKLYLTTTRQLLASDKDSGASCGAKPGQSDGCDLYLYDADLPEGERLIQVSEGEAGSPTPGEGAEVLSSITAASNDGTRAYFVAEGILTGDTNPEGDSATQGQPNLYLHRRDASHPDGELSFIGALSPADEGQLWGVERSFAGGAYAVPLWTDATNSTGGDGHLLLLASKAALTEEDADAGHRDVYRYDSQAETLQCLSCPAGSGASFDVSQNPYSGGLPALAFTEPGRWASEDGNTVAFASAEPLVEGDEDGASNPYLWIDGELVKLPAEINDSSPFLPTVSAPGNAVSFTTPTALLPIDGDTARDVYILRTNGGFPNPTPPSICDPLSEGSCQGAATTAPALPAAASGSFSGPGNQKSPPKCTKPRVRRKGRCVKPRKRVAKRRASHNKRGGRR